MTVGLEIKSAVICEICGLNSELLEDFSEGLVGFPGLQLDDLQLSQSLRTLWTKLFAQAKEQILGTDPHAGASSTDWRLHAPKRSAPEVWVPVR